MEVYTKEEFENMQRNANEPVREERGGLKSLLKAILLILLFLFLLKTGLGLFFVILIFAAVSLVFTLLVRLFSFWLWW